MLLLQSMIILRKYILKHIFIVTLLGALFGISEWFYSILGLLYSLTGIQNTSLVYITWAVLPTIIAIYESVRTHRALLAYVAANAFLVTAVLSYYASYVFDLLFLNTNDLLKDLHYDTINWPLFFSFVVQDIGSKVVEWTAFSLALGLVLGLVAIIIVALLEYVDNLRAAQR